MYEIIQVILYIAIASVWLWIILSWLNSEYNDEDKDITDATSPGEYLVRKFIKFFIRK